jgi:hypothetical protein
MVRWASMKSRETEAGATRGLKYSEDKEVQFATMTVTSHDLGFLEFE